MSTVEEKCNHLICIHTDDCQYDDLNEAETLKQDIEDTRANLIAALASQRSLMWKLELKLSNDPYVNSRRLDKYLKGLENG